MREPTRKERKQFKRKRDNDERKLKRNKLISYYLRRELRSCSTHGLPYIVNKEIHSVERLFWTACFVCCLGLMGSLISTQFVRYFRDPVVMSVEMDYFNWNISYPAITLCAKHKVDEENLQSLVNQTLENVGMNLTNIFRSVVLIGLDEVDKIDLKSSPLSQTVIEPRDFRDITPVLFKKFSNYSLTTSTNLPITVRPVLTELGMCHTLNSNVAIYDDPTTGKEETEYEKVNIELSVYDKDFFIQILDFADEYKLYLHHPDEIILITTPHYAITKGFMSYAVKVWSTRMADVLRIIPLQYRKCRFLDEPISDRYPVYSYNHCLLECRIRMMLKLCKCVPHFYKFLAHEKVCEIPQLKCIKQYKTELVKLSASEKTRRRFVNKDDLPKSPRACDCLNNCEIDVYLKDFETMSPQDSDRVRIGISSFPKVRVVRDIIFSIYDIILRSGGVMNLCIGTSIISLMELFLIAMKILFIKVMYVIELGQDVLRIYKRHRGNKQK